MKKRLLTLLFLLIILAAAGNTFLYFTRRSIVSAPSPTTGSKQARKPASAAPSFNKSAYSLTENGSLWQVVNKQRPFDPKAYIPADLVVPSIPLRSNITGDEKQVRKPMADALEKMIADASKDGVSINLQSGYRSYALQVNVYGNEVKNYGQAQADSESARPGFSEHQSGLAADLGTVAGSCEVNDCFANTPEGKWIAANGYKYGFIIRYPEGKEAITGYRYEPWHVRYVGVDLATEMHKQGIQTLEEFFGLPAAPNY